MKIALLSYNNYINRIAKSTTTIDQYLSYKTTDPIDVNSFNPNDGVDTEVVLNIEDTNSADYAIVYDDTTSAIKSKWFVMDKKRLRGGQCRVKLHRDVIVDNETSIKTSPAFIERATLPNATTNTLIFNSESSTYNQQLQSETLLKDDTQTPWIVGYVSNNLGDDQLTHNVSKKDYDYAWDSWESSPISGSVRTTSAFPDKNLYSISAKFVVNAVNSAGTSLRTYIMDNSGATDYSNETISPGTISLRVQDDTNVAIQSVTVAQMLAAAQAGTYGGNTLFGYMYNQLVKPGSSAINKLQAYNDKVVRIGVGGNYQYYKLTFSTHAITDEQLRVYYNIGANNELEAICDYVATYPANITIANQNRHDSYTISYLPTYGYLQPVALTGYSYSTTFGSQRNTLTNQPYTMFAIPYDTVTIDGLSCVAEASRSMAAQIATDLGGTGTSFLYDLQILPFAPSVHSTSGKILGKDYNYIKDSSNNNKSIIFWQTSDSGNYEWTIDYTPTNWKQSNETEFWRICSPNYNGIFDFSPAKNFGVSKIKAEWTYKPGTPYIKIAPVFKGLYCSSSGLTNNSATGCICGGDFSMAVIDDAWKDYTITNKNYLNIFDRQTQSLDLQNKWSTASDISGAITGALGAGMGAGFMTGNVGVGIAAGAVSGIAGAVDVYANEQIRKDNKSLQTDMFNYQLGNVQALPNSLAKVSAQNANFRYFPILEKYDATQNEKDNLTNNLKWKGMTINTVDTIGTYTSDATRFTDGIQYIQCRLLRNDVTDDTHMLNTINQELSSGYYFT